jgi:hypothetical protein
MLFLTFYQSDKGQSLTWTARLPLKLKTALPQAWNKYINHETLQYKRFRADL